jgi:hypothetical protein
MNPCSLQLKDCLIAGGYTLHSAMEQAVSVSPRHPLSNNIPPQPHCPQPHSPAHRLSHPTPSPLSTNVTRAIQAPMHVEPAPRRREAVAVSGRRAGGVVRGGEQGPGHGGGVERVQVVESASACKRKGFLTGDSDVVYRRDWQVGPGCAAGAGGASGQRRRVGLEGRVVGRVGSGGQTVERTAGSRWTRQACSMRIGGA